MQKQGNSNEKGSRANGSKGRSQSTGKGERKSSKA